MVHQRKNRALAAALLASSLGVQACGSATEGQALYEPWISGPGARQPAFLAFSSTYGGGPAPIGAADFPRLLSETGAFEDAALLDPVSGILPYEIQVPLWSDGALKRRWVSVPAGSVLGYSESGEWRFPGGTVFVKHFEMALDERFPEERRRLETRFWVAARPDAQYGVTYKWNEEQTDAELVLSRETEMLSIVGDDGQTRTQSYTFPGPGDCGTCHSAAAGFVLGARTAQLNRDMVYRQDRPALSQLAAWSGWGLVDARIDARTAEILPRLARLDDEEQPLTERVRSYWDGNCSMCHAGAEGTVPGWDARFATPFEEQGLERAPRSGAALAPQLITPGLPEQSFIYRRGDTTEPGMSMPPLGRNRVDDQYVDVLTRWISSLGEEP